MLSMSRLCGFLAGGAMLYVAWRLWRVLWRRLAWSSVRPRRAPVRGELALLLATIAGTGRCSWAPGCSGIARWPRSRGRDLTIVVFDFHSHTNVSHDVRGT